nr:uncharacterized protein LOC124818682 [Hydra vulgaris]
MSPLIPSAPIAFFFFSYLKAISNSSKDSSEYISLKQLQSSIETKKLQAHAAKKKKEFLHSSKSTVFCLLQPNDDKPSSSSSFFKDYKTIDEDEVPNPDDYDYNPRPSASSFLQMLIDNNKIARERYQTIEELKSENLNIDNDHFVVLYFDGRRHKTLSTEKMKDKYYQRENIEEHYYLVKEPGSSYVGQSDGKQYARRPQNQELSPQYTLKTVKHSGSKVIVWGSFSWSGVGPLYRIQGTMDQHIYKEILENVMLSYAQENLPLVWKFQQDNDPKHTAKSIKVWLTANKIDVLGWPTQSPDLNPIENLWKEVDRNINRLTATNLNYLCVEIKAAWDAITPERCQNLISSMGRRCQAVIDSKGYPTKY